MWSESDRFTIAQMLFKIEVIFKRSLEYESVMPLDHDGNSDEEQTLDWNVMDIRLVSD